MQPDIPLDYVQGCPTAHFHSSSSHCPLSVFSLIEFKGLLTLALERLLLGGLLGHLLLAGDAGLDTDAAKDEADAQDLHLAELVAKGDDGQDHGEHLARDGDGHEEDRGKGGEGVDCVTCLVFI